MAEIAHGEINIGLRDDATPELRRVEAEYRATMARIDRMEASAKVTANTENLDRQLKEARDRVRQLEGERATVTIKADKKALDAEIKKAKAQVKELDGKKATIQIETRGAETALAQVEAVRKAEAARAAAEERYARQRQRIAGEEERNRQTAEKAAYRANEIARKADLDAARQEQRVSALRNQYVRLTDEIENVDKSMKKGFHGRESQIKLAIDRKHLVASLEAAKAELKYLGGHPPVGIKIDTDRSDAGRLRNWINSLKGSLTGLAEKAGSIGHVRLNLGPFSGTIRTMALAVSGLAPILTSLLGSATALAGVLGTGLTGAAAVAGGTFAGLALNLGGVVGALHPAIADFKLAEKATTAYKTAVDKYGASSKQAKTAQAQMNSVLKQVDPAARQAAKQVANTSAAWHKLTGPAAKKALGDVLLGGVKTLNTLMPTLAHNTNQTFSILDSHITGIEKALRTPGAVRIFDSLGRSANNFLGPALSGLQHLGAAFGHIAEAAARLFAGKAGSGFDKWAADIDKATQPGAKLDGTIQRLGNHATDLLHFFGALGRLLVTVFNGGANSGDRMVKSMTKALDRWNKFLQGPKGKQDMASFFDRSESAVRALWGALAPLVAAFVQWSNLLAPFTAGLLKGVGFISNLVGGFTKLIGLGGPLTALGATIGAVFAVSKLGAFLSMLVRIGATMKELGALGSLKAILSGNFKSAMGGVMGRGTTEAAAIAEAHAQGAAEVGAAIRAAHAEGGAGAATEIAAGEAEGGAAAAAEIRGAEIAGGAASAGGSALGGAALGAEAGAARAGLGGLGGALAGAAGPATLFVGAITAAAFGLKALDNAINPADHSVGNFAHAVNTNTAAIARANTHYLDARNQVDGLGSSLIRSRMGLRDAKSQLDSTTKGTQAYKVALLNYRDALRENIQQQQQYNIQQGRMSKSAHQQQDDANAAVKANNNEIGALKKKVAQGGFLQSTYQHLLDATIAKQKGLGDAADAAANRVAALPLQAARAARGMVELSGQAEQALGSLAKSVGGKQIAAKINLKFEDPGQAAKVAGQAQRALGAGVSQKVIMRIIGDSSNAEQAIKRINNARVAAKRLAIRADEGDALAAIARVRGVKLSPKIQRLLHEGDPSVIAAVRRIVGMGIPAKTLSVLGNIGDALRKHATVASLANIGKALIINAVDHASSVWDSLRNSISNIVKTVTIVTKRTGHAEGGPVMPFEKHIPFGEDDPAYRRARTAGARETRGGRYQRPTLLVGEEDRSEYVIATNPAYRENNRDYLRMAAADLGMAVVDKAAKGVHKAGRKRAASPGTPGVHGTRAQDAALGVPDPYSVGAVPVDDVQGVVDKFDSGVQKQHDLVKSLTTTLRGIHVPHATKGNHRSVAAAKARIKDYKEHIKAAKYGGNWRNLHYRSLASLDKEDQAAKTDLAHIKHWNSQITQINARIDADRTRMGTDSSAYTRTGDGKFLTDWRNTKSDRADAIKQLIGEDGQGGILGAAKSAAQKLASKYPSDSLNEWIGSLTGDIESAASDLEGDQGPDPSGPAAPSLDDYINTSGQAGTLAALQRAYAVAQMNDVPDNPATVGVNENTASLSDNLSTAGNLQTFYQNLYNSAVSSGMPDAVVTDAANAYVQARDTYQGINDTINSAAQQTAQNLASDQTNYTSARADLFSQMGSNFAPIWAQTGAPEIGGFNGSGGAGQQNAAQPNTTQVSVVNNFEQPPPDPHTWSNGLSWELQAAV